MNPELKVGMPAMIIGCRHPENSYLIGTVVMIEEIWEPGMDVTRWYIGAAENRCRITVKDTTLANILVSECKRTAHDATQTFSMPNGYANLSPKYLMPLPPLDDDAIILHTETPKETEKC